MNSHYQTYSNLSSPHSPSPDENGSYTTLSSHTAGNSNGTNNNGIGAISGGGGNGGGNNGGNSSGNNIINSNGVNTNNNNSCNIGLGGNNNNATNSNHMNGHGNNNSISIGGGNSTGGNGNNIGIGNCNGINMVHHQNGSNEPHMQMDNDQPDFHHLHNNNNNNNNNSSLIKSCAGCGGKILERYLLHALDRYWHNSCLKCYCCGALLADIGSSCYTKAGMILCKSDYTRMFATAPCSSCGQIIAANEFVMRTTIPISNNQNSNFHHQQQLQQQQQQQQQHHQSNQQMPILPENQKPFLGQMEHHVFHLKCFTCSKCASQLRPGDRYYMLAGSLVCEPDWHKLLKNTTQSPPIRKGKVGRPRRTRD